MTYQPLHISSYETGLVQDRQNFLLPNDAYPVLENVFIFRERLQRKSGCKLLGRLRRDLEDQALGSLDGSGNFTGNIRVILSLEPNSQIEPGTLVITDGTNTFTDNGLGVLVDLTNEGALVVLDTRTCGRSGAVEDCSAHSAEA